MRAHPPTATSEEPAGYAHPAYAQSLAEFGEPLLLPRCGGHLISRPLPGVTGRDAIGSYPLFACRDWGALGDDLDELEGKLAAVAVVLDPFAALTEPERHRCFPDRVIPFKQHHVIDLSSWSPEAITSHHRRYVRRAQKQVSVDQVATPADVLDDWCELYSNLIERHSISGIARFSRPAFGAQLRVPGIVAFRARAGDDVVGVTLWYTWRGVAYYHLGAFSDCGYRLRASYALMSYAIAWFAGHGGRWLDLGGGAGITENAADGLATFKRGWATSTRTAYFCGRILDQSLYRLATRATHSDGASYFPAYRAGDVR